jgi:hypothetical protein
MNLATLFFTAVLLFVPAIQTQNQDVIEPGDILIVSL